MSLGDKGEKGLVLSNVLTAWGYIVGHYGMRSTFLAVFLILVEKI